MTTVPIKSACSHLNQSESAIGTFSSCTPMYLVMYWFRKSIITFSLHYMCTSIGHLERHKRLDIYAGVYTASTVQAWLVDFNRNIFRWKDAPHSFRSSEVLIDIGWGSLSNSSLSNWPIGRWVANPRLPPGVFNAKHKNTESVSYAGKRLRVDEGLHRVNEERRTIVAHLLYLAKSLPMDYYLFRLLEKQYV